MSVKNARVYDLNVEHTHNFIANGIVTHNCIYTWRGASVENLLEFDRTYPAAQTITLERNYRATKNLVDAANAVIGKNKNRKEKYATTEKVAGEPIVVHTALNAEEEARWIALKIKKSDVRWNTTRRNCNFVSHQLPVARAGGGIAPRRCAVQAHRHAVLRAQGGEGRARVDAARDGPIKRSGYDSRNTVSATRHWESTRGLARPVPNQIWYWARRRPAFPTARGRTRESGAV